MNTLLKLFYNAPSIQSIKLDNEISLQLESSPPVGPEESFQVEEGQLLNTPFRDGLC